MLFLQLDSNININIKIKIAVCLRIVYRKIFNHAEGFHGLVLEIGKVVSL